MSELWTRLLTIWANFSQRERMLIGSALGLTAIAILIVGIVQPLLSLGSNLEMRAEAAEQQLQAMTRLRREYDVVHASLTQVEARIDANREKRNLLTLLEALAKESSVKIDSMEERKAQDNDKFKETKVEVRLKRVSLQDTVSFLHAIESSDRLLTVKTLKIRNRPDRSQLLDVNFNVSTFDPL